MKPLAASLPAGVRRKPWRVVCGFATVAVMPALAQPALAHQAWAQSASRVQAFDIAGQDASSALLRLCLEAGCELAFVQRPGRDVRTRPVNGRMSWRAALARMLEGTDLRYRFVGSRGVRIWVVAPTARPTARPAAPPPPETTELEAVEVVGRLSDRIDEALRRKRDADVISDGLSSERIGDLPSANLAEALQRVPGVAIEREVGEGQFVSVRGLGPLFQSVTLNGAPVAFNENIRNSTQSGRQFRFRALSVDLLAGARLTKSATADLTEGGIGSNINIETAGGLDGDPFLTLRLGGETTTRDGRISPDLSVGGRWVSSSGSAGLVAGLSQEQRSVRYDRFQVMRYGEIVVDGRPWRFPTTCAPRSKARIDAVAAASSARTGRSRLTFALTSTPWSRPSTTPSARTGWSSAWASGWRRREPSSGFRTGSLRRAGSPPDGSTTTPSSRTSRT